MDKIMIGSMSTVIQVGFYENSEKIVNIPLGIITALGTVMLPKISNLQKKSSNDEIRKFLSIHTSIARGKGEQVRHVPVYMLGNQVSIINPYYGLLCNSHKEWCRIYTTDLTVLTWHALSEKASCRTKVMVKF